MRTHTAALALCCLAGLFTTGEGCAKPVNLKLMVFLDKDANDNTAVGISLVTTESPDVVADLMKITAKDWFNVRKQYLRDHPKNVTEESWEFVPGQEVPPIERKLASEKLQTILFVKYRGGGANRYRFDPKADLSVSLARNEVRVTGAGLGDEEPAAGAGEEGGGLKDKLGENAEGLQEAAGDVDTDSLKPSKTTQAGLAAKGAAGKVGSSGKALKGASALGKLKK